jgi:hypothetical protein
MANLVKNSIFTSQNFLGTNLGSNLSIETKKSIIKSNSKIKSKTMIGDEEIKESQSQLK